MRHGIGRKWLGGLLLCGALIGCSSSGHRRESQKTSTAEPPLGSAARVGTEEPVVQAQPAAAEEEQVAVTVTGRGADGSDIQGIVRMKASEAAAMGVKPGHTPGASYVPSDGETAFADATAESDVHPVSHQVEK
jgi:hypothetical protein